MYCSDISRTFPVSGRFLPHQRDVYDVVLAAERSGIAAARPGISLTGIHETVVRILIRGLLDLGLLKEGSIDSIIESGAYRRYYPHQTSHWLGLDVHDVGLYKTATGDVQLEPGMVFTIEPGLYIPSDDGEIPEIYRGMGIRLEDDLVVLEHGCEVITGGVPVEACAVESLIGTGR
jgi:Xaa-Pro aminopeptidase